MMRAIGGSQDESEDGSRFLRKPTGEHHEETRHHAARNCSRAPETGSGSGFGLILKLRAGRHTDSDDVAGILERVGDALDLKYLSRWARRLGIIEELNYVIDRSHLT